MRCVRYEGLFNNPATYRLHMINLEDFIPWVLKVATPFARAHKVPVRDSEFFADGCLGLAKAAEKFDPSLGNVFLTYAAPYVRGFILDGLKRRKPSRKLADGSVVQTTFGGEFIDTQADRCQSVVDSAQKSEELCRMRQAIERLPDDLREVINLRRNGFTVSEIGDRYGYTKQRASQVLRIAMTNLRQEMFANVK